jgi:mono/diheme cytochrome c family protein
MLLVLRRALRHSAVLVVLITAAGFALVAREQAPAQRDATAVDRGRITYGFYCMNCHGGDGRGGRDGGSDLTESEMLKADDGGREFAEFLPVGRPEQRMPPTPLDGDEIADLWAFLRVLVGAETPADAGGTAIEGDAVAGERDFRIGGCRDCHSVTGDLQGIGGRLDVATIHQRLLTLPQPDRRAPTPQAEREAAAARRGHADSVKKLSEHAVRDLAVYLATLR